MAIENVQLTHECSAEHLRMETARINNIKSQKKKASREERIWLEVNWAQKEVQKV